MGWATSRCGDRSPEQRVGRTAGRQPGREGRCRCSPASSRRVGLSPWELAVGADQEGYRRMSEPLFATARAVRSPPRLRRRPSPTRTRISTCSTTRRCARSSGAAGVGFIATVADVTEDAHAHLRLELDGWLACGRRELLARRPGRRRRSCKRPTVRVIVGAHPHNAKDFDERPSARSGAWRRPA
jgi:hypothetical protein